MDHEVMKSLGVGGMTAAVNVLSRPAEEFGNDENLELRWAIKAYHHAETYFNLISSVDNRVLKLTKQDDDIYHSFREHFPDLKVDVIDQEELKSEAAKLKWRPFCTQYEGVVEDFNFGTLLRLDCKGDYSEQNSIFVTRIQFFAVEIARNREELNLELWTKKQEKRKEEAAAKKEMSS
ncbi:protein PBDC1-like [Patiria miniata]|uniref:Polysaccharide biosynthesis domain-containing protein n=1 Tax=Patiria miniata TaxID=46514 RepID=A0A913Z5B5_PATMI|nr:protein PBDC1-like [Patiria miniata]